MKKQFSNSAGVLGGFPLGERGTGNVFIDRRGKAFPLIISLLLASVACAVMAAVECNWDGVQYNCSGVGNLIVTYGGGEGGNGGQPYVITNIVGVCTNCSNISPSDLMDLANQIEGLADGITTEISDIRDTRDYITNSLINQINEIETYQTFTTPSVATNYMRTANNGQSQGMLYVFDHTSQTGNTRNHQVMGAANGIYAYAKAQESQLGNYVNGLAQMDSNISSIEHNMGGIKSLSQSLRDGAVECEGQVTAGTNAAPPSAGSGSGSGTGRWCTEEQGNAITNLLDEIAIYLSQCRIRLQEISNFTYQTTELIKHAFFSDYTHIPSADTLGATWQQVYLDGAPTQWGYDPTNVLQRIELILYGLSSVGTNTNIYTENQDGLTAEEIESQVTDDYSELQEVVEDLATDADGTDAMTIANGLQRVLRSVHPRTSELVSGTVVLPAQDVSFGNDTIRIPAFTVDSTQDLSTINTIQRVVRAGMSFIYAIGVLIAAFMYWRWFGLKCIQLSQWAIELINSVFAS